MLSKQIPFTQEQLLKIADSYPTPFYIYDKAGIITNAKRLISAFKPLPSYMQYFAVKACPNPHILNLLVREGFGLDCSSLTELILAERMGLKGETIMFTSNNTSMEEFREARALRAIINLDDITHIACLEETAGLPENICVRYNPGNLKQGDRFIGTPTEAKFGMRRDQVFEAYETLRRKGVKRFGLHTMVASNELDPNYFVETTRILFQLALEVKKQLGITLEYINIGGGIGIPYHPDQHPMDLTLLGQGITSLHLKMLSPEGLGKLKIYSEFGRLVTGPFGYLVTRVQHIKDTYKKFVGVDATMADLMRPALYGAYHHISVMGKEEQPHDHIYDITGSLCENNDKLAINRPLPEIELGDILVVHDTGAHGHAMGFNYNGKLRSAELLLCENGSVELIRRAETVDDYFNTLDFESIP